MASYFKRKVATEVIKAIQSKSLSESETEKLGKKICHLVKVRPLKRGAKIHPSLFVNGDQLRQAIPEAKVHLKEEQGRLQIANGNFCFLENRNEFAQRVLSAVRLERDGYGYRDKSCRPIQRVCVEFSSPNVAKPFHVGHLRSTIIGNVVSNLYEAAGHSVTRLNFLGDWGTQFGLLMLGLERFRKDEASEDPLLHILQAYIQINQQVKDESEGAIDASVMSSPTYQHGMDLFARLEKGDEKLLSVWLQLRSLTISELDKMYTRLGVRFTQFQYESDYREQTEQILARLHEGKLLQYGDDGVGYVALAGEDTQHGRASVVKSDGSSLYLTRDLAAAVARQREFTLDRMHYVVEMGQRGHFSKLVGILKHLDVPWAHRPLDEVHIRFGRVQGMSTRKGQAIFLQEVLDEARSKVMRSMQEKESTRVTENVEEIADRLAVSSIILQDLKSHRAKDYKFSWAKMLSFKADSGVFVQYCHARLCSMMSNCGVTLSEDMDVLQTSSLEEPLLKLIIHIARYPEVFDQSLEMVEPHHIVQYLFQLCHFVNSAYAACPVKGENPDVAQARLLVFECSRQVIANCLQVLGISPLEQI